ncbi:hypothetical protein McpSp1_09130 [Methanocorpusculaceae archaeon Sp1]|nr:hypothetical protein [Methanocorpusculaceae archaeon Sp1]
MIHIGDCREILPTLPAESVDCVVTSPPYYMLRNYGVDGQIGVETTTEEYISEMVNVFREVRRVLKKNGTLWLNIGDTYSGSGNGGETINPKYQKLTPDQKVHKKTLELPAKNMFGIPWRVALALQGDGWILRQDIIWSKPNPMPESISDRCTKSHEYIFLFSKSKRYYFDNEAIAEPVTGTKPSKPSSSRYGGKKYTEHSDKFFRTKSGNLYIPRETRNKRDVWVIPTEQRKEAHFATFPYKLAETCILAGCPEGGTVLDPFIGSGTVGKVSLDNNRDYVGIELNPEYAAIAHSYIGDTKQYPLEV